VTILSKQFEFGAWPEYSDDEINAVIDVLKSGRVNYWTGEHGRQFESEFATFCNSEYGIALANGSLAIELALEAAGIGAGDDVIVTPRSYIASASSAVRVGARPVFADVCPYSQNMTAATINQALTTRTRAIILVHHAGWPCDMEPIMELAAGRNLLVIEDCAQAHGASYKGLPVGGLGHVAAFSFCQDKIMTTGGEGGMLVTNDREIWNKAWSIKDHGKSFDAVFNREHAPGFRWLHESFGSNWRMTEMQAAIGRRQLLMLPQWTELRNVNAKRIGQTLKQHDVVHVPEPPQDIRHGYYRLYAFVDEEKLRSDWSRDRIIEELSARGVPGLSGSCPEVYREVAFDNTGFRPSQPLPVAASLGPTSLAFLVHPTLSDSDLGKICNTLDEVLGDAANCA